MESRSRDRKESHTWKYFNEISSESVTCKLCAAVLKRTSGSTTSMLNHLERIHHLSLRHIKTQRELMAAVRGKTPTLKLKREAAIKAEKTMSKSTYEEEEEDEHLPKTGMSKQDPNTSEMGLQSSLRFSMDWREQHLRMRMGSVPRAICPSSKWNNWTPFSLNKTVRLCACLL
ncbi:uncharacterized protein LOC110501297 isoform X9 [Oncorhynchus mykiss]|uniref:uncharacterized protein LOC110501297 isoform X9 n=1 Tax=Oncorhynchus mykiss TaxID=8022 RepID=UPI001878DE85|nr:uncharacterized protein LOC110501297 isoform X9 [Oncorhynchus mykiss]